MNVADIFQNNFLNFSACKKLKLAAYKMFHNYSFVLNVFLSYYFFSQVVCNMRIFKQYKK